VFSLSRTTNNEQRQQSILCFRSDTTVHPDFLAVRKIPLKRRPYLKDNATEPDSGEVRQRSSEERVDESGKPIDPAVHGMLTLVRRKVLSDRSLHDQVSLFHT
jgi:hypothetical protein